MNSSSLPVTSAPVPSRGLIPRQHVSLAWLLFALLFALRAGPALAQDDDYLAIMGITDQADALNKSGQTSAAHDKYLEAQRALASFQIANPGWNARTVAYRLKYLSEKASATAENVTVAEKPAANSAVKLLDAGSEPRKVLRLHPAVGDKQTIGMTMKMDMQMGMAGNKLPAMDIPPMLMTLDLEVKNVSPDGGITYQLAFTDATVDAGTNAAGVMAAAMKTALDGIRGLSGSAKLSAQGILKSMDLKLPPGAAPQLSQTMGQMKDSFNTSATVLPDEAIGAGARWEYKTKLKTQGMSIDQTITYELVAIDGDQLTLHSTITQSAANQKMESPAMPGMKVDLDKMTGTGTGTTTQDLTKIMPLNGTLDTQTQISMGMNMGQQKQKMDMSMGLKISIESK